MSSSQAASTELRSSRGVRASSDPPVMLGIVPDRRRRATEHQPARLPFRAAKSKSRAMLDNSRRRGAWAAGAWLLAMTLGCDPNLPPEALRPRSGVGIGGVPWVEEPEDAPRVRVPEPVPAVEGETSRNLLQAYIDRDPDVVKVGSVPAEGDPTRTVQVPVTWEDESHGWRLPFQSKRLSAALLIAAAHDRLDSLRFILTPDATWGWPDPRRPGARPVFAGDDGEAFFQAFRKAAQRLPDNASWRSFPVPPGIQMLHATGAEPMWTAWADDQPTLIVVHLVLWRGEARIDYVGFFESTPDELPNLSTYGPPPPLVPPLRPPPAEEELADAPPAGPSGTPGAPPASPEAAPPPASPEAAAPPASPGAAPTPASPEAAPTPASPEAAPTPASPEAAPTPASPGAAPPISPSPSPP
jgi:hypothetical protein